MIKTLFSKPYYRHPNYDLIAEAEKHGINYGAEKERERIINLLDKHLGNLDWEQLKALIEGK
jgi:hypothetical protein